MMRRRSGFYTLKAVVMPAAGLAFFISRRQNVTGFCVKDDENVVCKEAPVRCIKPGLAESE